MKAQATRAQGKRVLKGCRHKDVQGNGNSQQRHFVCRHSVCNHREQASQQQSNDWRWVRAAVSTPGVDKAPSHTH
jgi:hypothetical protein